MAEPIGKEEIKEALGKLPRSHLLKILYDLGILEFRELGTLPLIIRKIDPLDNIIRGNINVAKYLGFNKVTVWRWKTKHDLPIMIAPDGTGLTSCTLIDSWILARYKAQKVIMQELREEETHPTLLLETNPLNWAMSA